MEKNSSKKREKFKSFLSIVAGIVCIVGIIAITAIFIKSIYTELSKTDAQRFADDLSKTTLTQTEVLSDLKEVCNNGIEKTGVNVKASFVMVYTLDNQYHISFNVLTDEDEYIKYEVNSSILAPLAMYLQFGDTYTTPYASEVETYMNEVSGVQVDLNEKVIDIG